MCAIASVGSFNKLYFTTPFATLPHRISMTPIAYDVLTAAVAGTLVGNEFAIAAFVHPQLQRLSATAHAKTAPLLASSLGRFMPYWYALALLLMVGATFEHGPISSGPGLLIFSSAVLWVIAILFTVTSLVPINNRIASMDPEQPHHSWLRDRCRWDEFHRLRVTILTLALVMLLTGLIEGTVVSAR